MKAGIEGVIVSGIGVVVNGMGLVVSDAKVVVIKGTRIDIVEIGR